MLGLTKKAEPCRTTRRAPQRCHISQGTGSSFKTSLCLSIGCLTDNKEKWVRGKVYSGAGLSLPCSLQVGLCPYPESSHTLPHLRAIICTTSSGVILSSSHTFCNYICYLCAHLISVFPPTYRLQVGRDHLSFIHY